MIVGEKSAYWWNTSVIYSDSECRNVMIGKTVRPGYECFKSAHSFSLFLNYTLFTTMPPLQTYGERPVVLLTVRASAPAGLTFAERRRPALRRLAEHLFVCEGAGEPARVGCAGGDPGLAKVMVGGATWLGSADGWTGWARHMRSTTSSPPATFTRKVGAPRTDTR